jgi:hypothetical protein
MRAALAAAMLLAASACAGTPPAGETACDASRAQTLVGQPASDALAARARRLADSSTVRFLRPGQIVTMEFRADRLNLVLDAQEKVEAIRCG